MLTHPATKYRPFPSVALTDRSWPNQTISAPPIWMSTDLRDGNQALFEPMNAERKLRMFKTLCDIGFKQIEVAFPSASQTDFDFVQSLIHDNHIPDDVTIVVLTQAREHLIRRTMESLQGAKSAVVHVYNATSKPFRDNVFTMTKAEVVAMAVFGVNLIKEIAAGHPETKWTLEYSPETFTGTELDFALEICNAVTAAWGATPNNKVILNLPTTVELATPNIYADQIEWMHRNLARRDSVLISLHPHMYTQGVSPGLDFSDINAVARTMEYCTQLPIHPRHPYVGDLVFTAFSGSHQDAIKKGFAAQKPDAIWAIPYLPIDPADVGRSYDSIIRINSQSGKGGVAYLLETEYGIVMPRRLQVEFSGEVQQHTDNHGGELTATDIWELFTRTYLRTDRPVCYVEHHLFECGNAQGIRLEVEVDGARHVLTGEGNGPIDAAVHALQSVGIGAGCQVRSYEERSISASNNAADAQACAFVELSSSQPGVQVGRECYGVGIDTNIVTASIKALISGVNRLDVTRSVHAK